MSKRARDDNEIVEEITEKKIKKWPFNPDMSTPQDEIDNNDDVKEGDILMTNTGNQASEMRYEVMKDGDDGILYPKLIEKPMGSDYYGGKRKRSRKTKKSRKSKKSRKTKRSKKSKKTRKSRK